MTKVLFYMYISVEPVASLLGFVLPYSSGGTYIVKARVFRPFAALALLDINPLQFLVEKF